MKFPFLEKRDPREKELLLRIEQAGPGEADIKAYIELGYIYLVEARYEDLLHLYAGSMDIEATDIERAEILYNMGVCMIELKSSRPALSDAPETSGVAMGEAASCFVAALELLAPHSDEVHALELTALCALYLTDEYEGEKAEAYRERGLRALLLIPENFPDFDRLHSIYHLIERFYLLSKDYEEALAASLKSLEIIKATWERDQSVEDDERAYSLLCVGDASRLMKKYDEAEAYYEEAARTCKRSKTYLSEIYAGLGHLYEEKGNIESAIESFLQALDKVHYRPTLVRATDYQSSIEYSVGMLYESKGESRLAIYHLKNALDHIAPDSHDYTRLLLAIGRSYYKLNKFNSARDAFKGAVDSKAIEPEELVEATYDLAITYDHLKEHKLLIEELEKLIDIEPKYEKDASVLFRLGVAYMYEDKMARALKVLEKILANELPTPKREVVIYFIANIHLYFDREPLVRKYLEKLEDEYPKSPLAEEIRGYIKKRDEGKLY